MTARGGGRGAKPRDMVTRRLVHSQYFCLAKYFATYQYTSALPLMQRRSTIGAPVSLSHWLDIQC